MADDDKATTPCTHCAGELQTAAGPPATLAPGTYLACSACGRVFNEDMALVSVGVGRYSEQTAEEETDEQTNE
jgi:hypothetical protein